MIFWKSMNPARLHALFDAYFRPSKHKADSNQLVVGNGKPTRYVDFDHPQYSEKSLAEYFIGG